MKRIISISPIILGILYAILPVVDIIALLFGYDFTLSSYPISIITIAVFSFLITLFLFKFKIHVKKAVFCALLLPLSAINGLYFAIDTDWKATIIFVLVCSGCSIALMIRYAQPSIFKIVSTVLSVLLIFALLFISFVNFVFGDFTLNTIVAKVPSPQNIYVVEVIDSDQGALGGNTYVDVYNNCEVINLLFCRFSKKPVRLYTGDWGEYQSIKIKWKNEHKLMINGVEYLINDQ